MGACFLVESGLVRVGPDSDAEAYVWGVAPFLGDSSVLVILLNVAPRKLVSSQFRSTRFRDGITLWLSGSFHRAETCESKHWREAPVAHRNHSLDVFDVLRRLRSCVKCRTTVRRIAFKARSWPKF